jgi:hypothetical protein
MAAATASTTEAGKTEANEAGKMSRRCAGTARSSTYLRLGQQRKEVAGIWGFFTGERVGGRGFGRRLRGALVDFLAA